MADFLNAASLDHINMSVKNLDESTKFYGDLFGFEVRKADNSPNKADVPSKIIGNDAIKLCMYEHPDMSPQGGIAHFGFHVANFDMILARCHELKVEVLYAGTVKFEGSRSIYVRDPNGYDIELSEVAGGGL